MEPQQATTLAVLQPQNVAPALPLGKTYRGFDARDLYKFTIDNLHLEIKGRYGSVKKFCEVFGLNRWTLSRCFTADVNDEGREMSVGLYYKILLALGILSDSEMPLNEYDRKAMLTSKVTVREQILLSRDLFLKSIVFVSKL